ncbi:phage tail spike protein [Weissella sp. GP1]|uniref:phage tail spike protein n=1 Tax=Weissella confusa TaxID=1583 RepID=UPI0032DBA03E
MTPILYSSDEIDFLNNGLGQLVDLYDVDIHEQRNGLLNLTAYYPVNGQHYADISEGNIILAKPSPLDNNHAFRIVSVALDITGYAVMIEADSITYDLTNNLSKTIHMLGDGQAAMTAIQNSTLHPHIFTFYSDITHTSESQLRYVNPMEAIAGTQGSFLQIWGGELKRENRRVAMFNRRGRDNVATFRLGKNIAGLKYTVDVSKLTTEIVPTVTVNSTDVSRTIEGATVQSSRMGNYPLVYSKMVDVSQDVKVDEGDTDDQIKAKINAFAADWFVKSANTGKDLPEVTVEVEVESLQDSADYADKFAKLETIGLTDTVTVYVPEFGVNVTAIVNELHYDPVAERVTKLSIGTAKVSWADSNKNALNDLQDKVTEVKEQANQAIVSANGKSKNHYGRDAPEHPQEGDTWFWNDGENSGVKVWVNGKWVDSVDTQTNERIDHAVDSAVNEATSHADSLNLMQASIANSISASAAAALASASTARSILASNASSMANSAAAKGSSAANSAYTAAMSGAAAAVNALSSNVGVKITSTSDSLNGKLATAITSADVTASSYATVARNEAVATASQNATAITSLAISNFGSQVASAYVKNTTFNQTASAIQLAATQLQTQVNAMGQVNQLFNTEFSPDLQGWFDGGSIESTTSFTDGNEPSTSWMIAGGKYNGSSVVRKQVNSTSTNAIHTSLIPVGPQTPITASVWQYSSSDFNGTVTGAIYLKYYDSNKHYIGRSSLDSGRWLTWQRLVANVTTPDNTAYISFNIYTNGNSGINYYAQPMLVFANNVGDYVPGNYNNNARVSSLELNVDGITGVVNDPSKGLSATWNLANNGQSIAVQASNAATTALTAAQGVQTTVANFQLGTQNYIVDGGFETGNGHGLTPISQTATYPQPFGDYMGRIYDGTSAAGADIINYFTLPNPVTIKAGEKWTISYYYATSTAATGQASDYAYGDDGQPVFGVMMEHANHVTTGGQQVWQRYTKTFTLTSDKTITKLRFGFVKNSAAGGWKVIDNIQLERGNMVSDWHPAPEDTDNAIQSVRTQLAGQISDEVTNRTNGDNSVKQQMTDLISQKVTSVTTGYKSSLLETSNALVAQISSLNLLNNSQFEVVNGTLPGWHVDTPWGATVKVGDGTSNNVSVNGPNSDGTTSLIHDQGGHSLSWLYSDPIPTMPNSTYSGSFELAEGSGWATSSQVSFARYIRYYTSDHVLISSDAINYFGGSIGGAWPRYSFTVKTPANAAYVSFGMGWNGGKVSFRHLSMYSGSKDYGYMPGSKSGNQTVLQLFKDNWAIGIKDNTGNIISGINGDPSGMTIAAKKLTVSADTTFLGTNWLNGAVIKDASISNAQIADAAITSAKIVNLDVNKISGEVANFIRAYWDGQYGSTSITSEGMTVSAGATTTVFDENGMQLNKSSRSIGRIGVNDLYQDNSKKGLYFGLESTGDFMAWGAQNYAGNPYDTKLSWYRVGSVPSNLIGTIEGFNFQDNVLFNRPVEMRAGIKIQGTDDKLVAKTTSFNGFNYPTFGTSSAGLAYGSVETYLISNGTAYNLSKIIKALSGISSAAIPSGFSSDGKATGWYNVNFK